MFGTSHSSTNGVFHGILFAVTLFIGFEAAASIGEEAHDPHRSIPIALIGSVALAGLFYLLVTYAAAIGFGVKGAATAWPADPSPMGTLAQHYVGKGLATTIDLVVLLDSISVAIAFVVAGSRVFFALARDGLLPPLLARTSRADTPLGGNLVILAAGDHRAGVRAPVHLRRGGQAAQQHRGVLDQRRGRLVPDRGCLRRARARRVRVHLADVPRRRPGVAVRGRGGRDWPRRCSPTTARCTRSRPIPTTAGSSSPASPRCSWSAWFTYLQLAHPARVRNAAQHAAEHHGVPPLDETLNYAPAEDAHPGPPLISG